MRKLVYLLPLLALSLPAWGQGNCSAFAAGSCPANVPSGVTQFYFIDGASGSDSNSGTTESAPFLHLPGCANATGNAAAVFGSTTGTGWILKGGTTQSSGCYPAQLPYGGTSGAKNYIGYDPGWPASGWTRPILNGGGSSGYDATTQGLLSDATHQSSHLVIDDLEISGLYWGGMCSSSSSVACTYVAMNNFSSTGHEADWEVRDLYVHNITNCNNSSTCNDPAGNSGIIWAPNAQSEGSGGTSSTHDSYFDNTDGSANCCRALQASNIYNNFVTGFYNFYDNDVLTDHDNYTV